MDKKKVSLAAIRLRAGEVAAKAGISREVATQTLLDAHGKLGIEVDFSSTVANGNRLDFTKKTELEKTQPFARTQPLHL